MNWKVAAVLALVVAVSGCSSFMDSRSPMQKFQDLSEERESSTYHVKYSLSMPALGEIGSSLSGIDIQLYNMDGKRKSVVSSSLGTSSVTANYRIGNHTVTCEEGGLYSEGVSCRMGESGEMDFTGSLLEGGVAEINYTGSRTIAGRSCEMFTVVPNETEELDMSYTSGSVVMDVCLDSEKGYFALLAVNSSTDSELGGSSSDTVLRMKVTEHDEKVSQSDLRIPVSVGVDSYCSSSDSLDSEVSITPFQDLDQATLSVNGENRSVKLRGRFEAKDVAISDEELVEGSNQIAVYTGDGKQTDSCSYYDYSDFDYSYGEAEESDVDLSQYSEIDERLENADFSDYSEADQGTDFSSWTEEHGDTHDVDASDGFGGTAAGLSWKGNSLDADPAWVSQEVDLTDVEAVGIDVAGGTGNPQRSKIVLEVDGVEQGTFIESPQSEETYRDLGVELDRDYTGTHTLKIKWVQVQGDNLGSSMIDNVRLYE